MLIIVLMMRMMIIIIHCTYIQSMRIFLCSMPSASVFLLFKVVLRAHVEEAMPAYAVANDADGASKHVLLTFSKNGAQVVDMLMKWLRALDPYLNTGIRACLRVRLIPQLRLLNRECSELWATAAEKKIAQLVASDRFLGWNDYRIPEFLRAPRMRIQDIGLSPENVELVKFLLRFKRSGLLVARTTNATKLATASYDRRGAVAWVNAAMLEHLQHQLQWDVQVVQNAMQSASCRHKWRQVLSTRHASSVPRVIHETPNTRSRSKSLPQHPRSGMVWDGRWTMQMDTSDIETEPP
jgi:hypothetical protein